MSETLMNKNNIPYLSTTNKSIEEISSSILQKINPEVITSSRI
jgi:regulator of PEP synthase PpsR (kinase-PPPase family)